MAGSVCDQVTGATPRHPEVLRVAEPRRTHATVQARGAGCDSRRSLSPVARGRINGVTAAAYIVDLGSASLTLTRNRPSLISCSLALAASSVGGVDQGLVGDEAAAAIGHVAVLAVVGRLEAAFGHRGDGAVDGRLHVPQGAGEDRAGIVGGGVDDVADRLDATLLGRVGDAETLGIEDVGAGIDHREGGFLGLRRVVPGVDEGDEELDVGIDRQGAFHEGVHQPVDLGNGVAADHADDVRLGGAAGDHAGQVARLVDEVVEDGEVRLGRAEGRSHQEGDVGIVGGDAAGGALDAEGLADDQVVALLGIFAHDALIVGVGDILGIDIVDVAALLGGVERLVDAADPLLLDRDGVDGGDLDRLRLLGGGRDRRGRRRQRPRRRAPSRRGG